jgi:TonB-linked SusC/RagA family outer membrane protein
MKKNLNYYKSLRLYSNWRKLLLIMKIAVFLFFFGLINLVANPTYSQNTKISLNMKGASVESVLSKIEDISEFYFLYNQKLIDVERKVDVAAEEESIKDILSEILPTDVRIIVSDRQIVLTPTQGSTSFEILTQQLIITGSITDSQTGESMPGVNIRVEGSNIGTMSDANGKYSIDVPDRNAVLLFSFIGYTPQRISSGGRTIIDISLVSETLSLEEVVVIGYGTQKKVNVIGSVRTVSDKELDAAPVSMVSNALSGRMPGVIVQQGSGEPGDNAAAILIRGKSTLGNNSPLIVVDGIADRDMNSIQPTDIESITVLKDASAAIYGARSANGVILITTKRGTSGAPTVSYGFYQGALTPTKLPEMCDAATYAQMIREMQSYRNVAESNMLFSLEDIEKYKSGKYPWTHPNTDWFAEAFKDYSNTRNHNISLSGGTQSVTYYGSFGSQIDEGIYTNSASYYKRYNLKAAVDAKVNKYISVGIDIIGSQENSMFPTRGESTIFSILRRSKPTDPAFFPNGLPGPDINWGDNPVVVSGFDPGYDNLKNYRLNTKMTVTLNVPGISGLTLSGYYAYDKYLTKRKLWEKPFTLYSLDKQAYLNAGNDGSQDGSAFLVANFPKGMAPEPRLTDSYGDSDTKVFNIKANYDKTIGGIHNISAFISMESSDYLAQGITAFRRYFISDQLPYLFAGGNTDWSNNGNVSLDSRLNYFGRLMYNLKETYLLQFSLRRDGSLRFSKESGRWGTFPSVLAGWRISNENFWKNNIKFIDYLKLKASFGQMGNDNVASFQYLTSYAFVTGKVLTGTKVYQSGLGQSGVPNPNITWEVANVFNVGFESIFLNSKLTFNTDFFYQRRNNILVKRDASVPTFTGIALPDENFGIVDNKGFELEIGYNDSKGDFKYSINGNLAYTRNKIVEFDEPAKSVPWQVLTGHQQGVLLLYKSIGVFRDQAQVDSLPHVNGARPGDIIIEDYDKNEKIDSDDRIIFDKTADPSLTYAVSFNLNYKNWDLGVLVQGVGTTLRSIASDAQTGTIGNYYAYEAIDRWTADNIDATKPRAYEREEEYWRTSYPTDYNYQKGGFARLKNIQLSYSVPKRICDLVNMKNAQLYFSGQNLFLIYNQNKILDPETGNMLNYPIMKVYALGIKVTF